MQIFCIKSILYVVAAISTPAFPGSSRFETEPPGYPTAPRVPHVRSLPLLPPRFSSPGLCWPKVFISVVFICVSGWAVSPSAAAAAAWALPWGTLSKRGRMAAGRVSQSCSAQRISGDLKRFNILLSISHTPPPIIRSLYCVLGKYCNCSACP